MRQRKVCGNSLQFLPDESFDPRDCRLMFCEVSLAFDGELKGICEGSQQTLIFLLACPISGEPGIECCFALWDQPLLIHLQLLVCGLHDCDLCSKVAFH